MAKHEEYAYFKNNAKQLRFKPLKLQDSYLHQHNTPPQIPARKTNSNNRFLTGRGW